MRQRRRRRCVLARAKQRVSVPRCSQLAGSPACCACEARSTVAQDVRTGDPGPQQPGIRGMSVELTDKSAGTLAEARTWKKSSPSVGRFVRVACRLRGRKMTQRGCAAIGRGAGWSATGRLLALSLRLARWVSSIRSGKAAREPCRCCRSARTVD
jgi:hypothetical protein